MGVATEAPPSVTSWADTCAAKLALNVVTLVDDRFPPPKLFSRIGSENRSRGSGIIRVGSIVQVVGSAD
jgi:hypothetical protein